MATRQRPGQTGEASHGSRTLTIHDVPTEEQQQGEPSTGHGDNDNVVPPAGVLRLRGGGNTRRVVWSEGTVDNEGMGKKKSKICCIYHKPRAFDESSGESSSSGSSESDSGSDSDSDASSSVSSEEVNASKALREKRAAAGRDGKGKARAADSEGQSETCDVEQCSHTHGNRKDRSRKSAVKKTKRSGGSRTVTITEPSQEEHVPQSGGEEHQDPISGDPRHPLPNAYERGPS